jgi:rRNA maturation endonuclease Nob1
LPTVVNDTGAIISGLPLRLPAKHYTTTLVVKEVKDKESRELLNRMLEIGRLEILDPSEKFVRKALVVAKKAKVHKKLSEADVSVLALALELTLRYDSVLVATDDYALQIAARTAGLEIIRIRYRGITG